MADLGPFEANPHMAVAASGGPDSIALTVLVEEWTAGRGGRLEVLTVDHGLRADSDAEAAAVGRMMRRRGLRHHILRWVERKPESGIQQAAREARYRLMLDWCARAGILHLLVAHHLEDQAETFLMRIARGSGKMGLAAMSRIVEHRRLRLLRPCLGVTRDRLRVSLKGSGLEAMNDPSNEDRRFARVRIRAVRPELTGQGLPEARLAHAAADFGEFRERGEREIRRALAVATSLHPSGYCLIRIEPFRALPRRVQASVLEALLMTVGGNGTPPRRQRLNRLRAVVESAGLPGSGCFAGATLGGCRIVPFRGDLLVCREPAAARERIVVREARPVFWDGRFEIVLRANDVAAGEGPVCVARLGEVGWKEIVALSPRMRETPIPWPARLSLPILRDRHGILEVPHLAYRRADAGIGTVRVEKLSYRPSRPLAGPGFVLV